jgi:hypothetical protein
MSKIRSQRKHLKDNFSELRVFWTYLSIQFSPHLNLSFFIERDLYLFSNMKDQNLVHAACKAIKKRP